MPLPVPPRSGMVIRYEYLWRDQHERGDGRGEKKRPCAIVIATTNAERGRIETIVAPITHTRPRPPTEGVLIPPRVRRSLGLDGQDCWAIVTDLNAFDWPGPDIYPVPGQPPGTYLYGFLPPRLFDEIIGRIAACGMKATERVE